METFLLELHILPLISYISISQSFQVLNIVITVQSHCLLDHLSHPSKMSSSSSPIPHILLLGSTGFLGGSVLSFLLPNITISPPKYTISALVRSAEKAKWLETNNIRPVLGSLNDTALIEEEASKADILINTADSDHLPSARAAVAGLTKRFNQQQKKPLYLHTRFVPRKLSLSREEAC
jgi:hypothetical protein